MSTPESIRELLNSDDVGEQLIKFGSWIERSASI
jgi:hypothetical protein